jgi:hypothetical protein
MSHFPLVYISSDDSSDSEISYYSDSDFEDQGWNGYFPPNVSSSSMSVATSTITDATSTTNPKPKKKKSVPAPCTSLANELPTALTQALKSAIKNMKWPAPRKERPPKQVLGLPCPRKQASFDDKRKTAQKGKQSYEGKGKRPMK